MIQCPKCSAEIAPDSRFCKSCGQPFSSPSQMPTMEAPAAEVAKAAATPHVARIISSDSIPAGGFTPGAILADRYRIIGLLGRGGMGEVYRADDLKLGQPVALKFLPPKLADDPVRRERLFAEVRIARQVSHPNICRVYDIGELEGRHFLTMEYIDGEDLASLLKRIGSLHGAKAVDVAQQLCAGLAAAHDKGVLHRDLKPANVMIDGRGRVRITDFGLAVAADEGPVEGEVSGTPPYMAPEQFAGKGASVRSDIYALGLVIYEVFTGKRAFEEKTLAELRSRKETSTPTAPSEIARDIDPIVERVILRCIEKDPRQRPASAMQVAAALPGGDPLAAALAAGETPSPEMVAASGSKEGLRPAVAWGILGFIIVVIVAAAVMKDRIAVYRLIPMEKKPEALVERSHEILKKVGYTEESQYSTYGFISNGDLLIYEDMYKTADSRRSVDAKAVLFWYRESSRPFWISDIGPDNPPLERPGDVLVMLDAKGRLTSFRSEPSPDRAKGDTARSPDWSLLFSEAGLDISQWKAVETQWIPDSYADVKAAWDGSLPNFPGTKARVQAASYQGRPVSFEIIGPWAASAQAADQQPVSAYLQVIGYILVLGSAMVGGVIFARRNMRLGRGDRRNAYRLAIFVLGLSAIEWALGYPQASRVPFWALTISAVLVWVFYMAVEPSVRRRWPKVLVSWTRLLSGEFRDPLVGRDMLVGCALGVFIGCISYYSYLLPWRFLLGFSGVVPDLQSFTGARFVAQSLVFYLVIALFLGLATLCVLVVLRALLRNQKAAIVLGVAFMTLGTGSDLGFGAALIYGSLWFFALMRFGFLAAVLTQFALYVVMNYPFTLEISAWYAGYGYLALAIFAAIVLYAFRYSLGGQPMFGRASLED